HRQSLLRAGRRDSHEQLRPFDQPLQTGRSRRGNVRTAARNFGAIAIVGSGDWERDGRVGGDVEMTWPMVSIEEACSLVTDGTHYTPPEVETGIPFLTVKDMNEHGLDFNDCSQMS